MAAIHFKNTKPELLVRKLLHEHGYRFRLHTNLPGKPDISLARYSTVVFVHGCFWHMHKCRYGCVTPQTNAEFWRLKREGNVARDKRNARELRKLGWRVIVVWECETRDPEKLAKRLTRLLPKD